MGNGRAGRARRSVCQTSGVPHEPEEPGTKRPIRAGRQTNQTMWYPDEPDELGAKRIGCETCWVPANQGASDKQGARRAECPRVEQGARRAVCFSNEQSAPQTSLVPTKQADCQTSTVPLRRVGCPLEAGCPSAVRVAPDLLGARRIGCETCWVPGEQGASDEWDARRAGCP